jgi:hypothetical protein
MTMIALLGAAALPVGCGGGSVDAARNPGGGPSGSSPPPAVLQAKDAGTAVNPSIVAADNGFALGLFQTLSSGAAGNVAISPISVALSLQIVYNGAAGTTQQAMAHTLQLAGLNAPQDLNAANAALQGSLVDPDPDVQLVIANSLWMHLNDNPVLPSFTQTDETYYGAPSLFLTHNQPSCVLHSAHLTQLLDPRGESSPRPSRAETSSHRTAGLSCAQSGAGKVVLSTHIGAERIAELLLYQESARFIDGLEKSHGFQRVLHNFGMELEVITAAPQSPAVSMTVAAIERQAKGAFFIVQINRRDGDTFTAPPADTVIAAGDGVVLTLPVHQRHHLLGVARAGHFARRQRPVEGIHVRGREHDGAGGDVLFEIAAALGAGDGHDGGPLVQQPRERDLTGLEPFGRCDIAHGLRGGHIGIEICPLIPRVVAPVILLGVFLGAHHGTGQEAAAQRREGHEADAELPEQRNHLGLEIAFPQGVFALQRGYRMHCVSLADVRDTRLGHAEVAHLAFAHQFAHGAGHVRHGDVGIDAVLVEKIDVIRSQALQRGVHDVANVGRAAVGAFDLSLDDLEAELGGQRHLRALVGQGAAEQFLVGKRAVNFRGIEEGAA